MQVKLKRAYEAASQSDGTRILVDRMWPRRISKEKAKIDLWLKDLAPSKELRKWFGHDPDKWEEFQDKYFQELENNQDQVKTLVEQVRQDPVTLVYSAKDPEHNNAVVLKKYLHKMVEET